jgi:2-phospho-L-lactate guanylyltransferase (CobY/MobA/RfbA family)
MSFPTSAPIAASYGARSFERHLDQALAANAPLEVRHDRDLSLDLDTAADLRHPLLKEVLPAWLRMNQDSRLSMR